MKSTTSITLDTELMVEAKAKHINLSREFNNHLKVLLEMEEEDAEASINDRIINAKARLLSLEADKERKEKEEEKRYGKEIEL